MEYYSAIEKNEILPLATVCMDLEKISNILATSCEVLTHWKRL